MTPLLKSYKIDVFKYYKSTKLFAWVFDTDLPNFETTITTCHAINLKKKSRLGIVSKMESSQ